MCQDLEWCDCDVPPPPRMQSSSEDDATTCYYSSGEEEEEPPPSAGDEPSRGGAAAARPGICALSDADGVVYVGRSWDVARRLAQQHNLFCTALEECPLLTIGSLLDLESWERNEVLTRMHRFGMQSTRGWRFGRLTRAEQLEARAAIIAKFRLCPRCGRSAHFGPRCVARTCASWCAHLPLGERT